jgi:hypothetical protein
MCAARTGLFASNSSRKNARYSSWVRIPILTKAAMSGLESEPTTKFRDFREPSPRSCVYPMSGRAIGIRLATITSVQSCCFVALPSRYRQAPVAVPRSGPGPSRRRASVCDTMASSAEPYARPGVTRTPGLFHWRSAARSSTGERAPYKGLTRVQLPPGQPGPRC